MALSCPLQPLPTHHRQLCKVGRIFLPNRPSWERGGYINPLPYGRKKVERSRIVENSSWREQLPSPRHQEKDITGVTVNSSITQRQVQLNPMGPCTDTSLLPFTWARLVTWGEREHGNSVPQFRHLWNRDSYTRTLSHGPTWSGELCLDTKADP